MKRLFIAIPIRLSDKYNPLISQLRQKTAFDRIVWMNAEGHHLTLRFIGKTPEFQIPSLKAMLDDVGENFSPFSLKINKLSLFGSSYAPKVIWLGFEDCPYITQIFSSLENKLTQQLNFKKNDGNFVPHLTLGRIKKVDNKKYFSQMIEQLQPDFHQEILVEKIILYQSILNNSGPVYVPLHEVELKRP